MLIDLILRRDMPPTLVTYHRRREETMSAETARTRYRVYICFLSLPESATVCKTLPVRPIRTQIDSHSIRTSDEISTVDHALALLCCDHLSIDHHRNTISISD